MKTKAKHEIEMEITKRKGGTMLLQINKVQSTEAAASTLSFSRRGKALNASADYKLACLGIWLAGWLPGCGRTFPGVANDATFLRWF